MRKDIKWNHLLSLIKKSFIIDKIRFSNFISIFYSNTLSLSFTRNNQGKIENQTFIIFTFVLHVFFILHRKKILTRHLEQEGFLPYYYLHV